MMNYVEYELCWIHLESIASWTILILPIYEWGDFFFIFDFQWFAYDVSRYRSLYIDSAWVLLSLMKEYINVFKKFGDDYSFFPKPPHPFVTQIRVSSYDCGLFIWVANGSFHLLTVLPRLSQVIENRVWNADILLLLRT